MAEQGQKETIFVYKSLFTIFTLSKFCFDEFQKKYINEKQEIWKKNREDYEFENHKKAIKAI